MIESDNELGAVEIEGIKYIIREMIEEQEENEMANRIDVPVTGAESDYDFEQAPFGHVDRTEQVRRVVELGLRYIYEFNRVDANLELDEQAARDDRDLLRRNRLQVFSLTGGEE